MLNLVIACVCVLLAGWCLWRLLRFFSRSFWLLLFPISAALHRRRLTGEMPWHHNHALRAQIAGADTSDEGVFHRLARQAMAYATRPRVTVMHHVAYWPDDPVLVRTTADPFGRRVYIETLRIVAGQVLHVACLYLDGGEVPAEVGSIQVPAERTNAYVLKTRIEEIVRDGACLSYRDAAGRIREARLPNEVKHRA